MKIPEPNIRSTGISIIWLIPFLTLVIGAWLIVKTLNEQGPEVTITFNNAEGIEAGKTRIRYRNIDIGIVEHIEFNDDFSEVILVTRFNKNTENFLRRDTRFWVVKPQLGIQGVSGLGTLLSGSYIELEPGEGARQNHFIGLNKPPVVKADKNGTEIILSSDTLRSIGIGSPVFYQGIQAGEILGYELANDNKTIYIHAFINAPFDELVGANTRFWNVSGVDVSVNANGFSIRTESIRSILLGGIAFETPETLQPLDKNISSLVFTLYDKHEDIVSSSYTNKINFIVYFQDSVRGLSIGAPVEFKGIRIGQVKDIRLEFDREKTSFRIPVLLEVEPERIIERGAIPGQDGLETIQTLIDRGLRAQLQTGNLLTGQLYIDMDMHPDTDIVLSGEKTPFFEIPALTASFEIIKYSFQEILAKINQIEIDKIGTALLSTLNNTNRLISADEIHESMKYLSHSLKQLNLLLTDVNQSNPTETINAAKNALLQLDEFMQRIKSSLTTFDDTLQSTQNILNPSAPMQYHLIRMSSELENTARAIRSLVELIERNPQSILFGRKKTGE